MLYTKKAFVANYMNITASTKTATLPYCATTGLIYPLSLAWRFEPDGPEVPTEATLSANCTSPGSVTSQASRGSLPSSAGPNRRDDVRRGCGHSVSFEHRRLSGVPTVVVYPGPIRLLLT